MPSGPGGSGAPGAGATLPERDLVAEFAPIGITAFTTTRAAGDFSMSQPARLDENTARWHDLHLSLRPAAAGLASATQLHGVEIADHAGAWDGWLRVKGADAHIVRRPGGSAAVTIADCVPVFVAHPAGLVALVHAGWRGTAARLLPRILARVAAASAGAGDLYVHLGPGICGRCYEVGPDVYEQLTGWQTIRHRNVDLRALLAEQARAEGVRHLSASVWCTRCDNDRYFSHRGGDLGRQVAVVVSRAPDG